MNALETQFPPIAQALGRLRQPRAWPYAARPAELATPDATPPLPLARPVNDLLCMLPEPVLTGELPAAKPLPELPTLRIPGPEAARTYWFDL